MPTLVTKWYSLSTVDNPILRNETPPHVPINNNKLYIHIFLVFIDKRYYYMEVADQLYYSATYIAPSPTSNIFYFLKCAYVCTFAKYGNL